MMALDWTNARPERPRRPLWPAMLRGFFCRCPQCGAGSMFGRFLKVSDKCARCGEELSHQRADDAPAYFVIMIVGHVVVPLALALETAFAPEYWVHLALWMPLTIGLALALLQPVKGAIVALQWANCMHGFRPMSPDADASAGRAA
jgi:uncharacterized protein (DUF983 family)